MTQEEIQTLIQAVRSRTYDFIPHAMDRMKQKGVKESQIKNMLTYCTVIEAHQNFPGDTRVLVRGKVAGHFVCAVVSLKTNHIITTYWNKADDHHKNLDFSLYKLKTDFSSLSI